MKKQWMGALVKWIGALLSTALLIYNYTPDMRMLRRLPEKVHVSENGSAPALLDVADREGSDLLAVSAGQEQRLSDVAGGKIEYRLFGVIPVKTVEVVATDPVYLAPGGAALGITIRTQGVLVVGLGAVHTRAGALSPGSAAGLRAGDIILSADGETLSNADHLMRKVQASANGKLRVQVERNGAVQELEIQLVREEEGGAYRIGLWVRDSTAGVGTLSFCELETGWFAALGHPVSDIDTQSLLHVREGKILPAQIVEVKKGREGEPGELMGLFQTAGPSMGSILKNSEFGIFGMFNGEPGNGEIQPLPMGYSYEAHTGPAQLLATVSTDGVQAFQCEIIRVNTQSDAATKGMVIAVTDERLLEATGGIVQGMSGCPVVQDGKLIGVVTHVFVNDPTKGYCVYAEWMREEILQAAG